MWLFMEKINGKYDPVIFKKQRKLLRDKKVNFKVHISDWPSIVPK